MNQLGASNGTKEKAKPAQPNGTSPAERVKSQTSPAERVKNQASPAARTKETPNHPSQAAPSEDLLPWPPELASRTEGCPPTEPVDLWPTAVTSRSLASQSWPPESKDSQRPNPWASGLPSWLPVPLPPELACRIERCPATDPVDLWPPEVASRFLVSRFLASPKIDVWPPLPPKTAVGGRYASAQCKNSRVVRTTNVFCCCIQQIFGCFLFIKYNSEIHTSYIHIDCGSQTLDLEQNASGAKGSRNQTVPVRNLFNQTTRKCSSFRSMSNIVR